MPRRGVCRIIDRISGLSHCIAYRLSLKLLSVSIIRIVYGPIELSRSERTGLKPVEAQRLLGG